MFALLHEHPELLDGACDLLNAEWPRSKSARVNGLSVSCDNLPLSALLVNDLHSKSCQVVGHAKLIKLFQDYKSCWVESVIIHPKFRGKGFGKELMLYCEDIARQRGFTTAYLSTHDKQNFYLGLGYEFCAPVCLFGGGGLFPPKAQQQNGKTANNAANRIPIPPTPSKPVVLSSNAPPPPPLPVLNASSAKTTERLNSNALAKTYMKKSL